MLVGFLAGAGALTSPPKAEADCSLINLCIETDPGGTAHLNVPPLSQVALFRPEVKPLEDCLWEVVDVNFGDGSPTAVYVWDATKNLTGSHTFPHPGEYKVKILATSGHHLESLAVPPKACPDLPVEAKVIFPSGSEKPAVETPVETPGKTPVEMPGKSPGSGEGAKKGGSGAGKSIPAAEEEKGSGPSHPILIYKRCPEDIYTHRVPCTKAAKVIAAAIKKLSTRRAARITGFRCTLDPSLSRPISCRRGDGRILGPLG